MNPRWQNSGMWWAVGLAVLVFGIWSQPFAHSAAPAAAVEKKTIALRPARIPVATPSLAGSIEGLTVITRVDHATGHLVDNPDLRATLRLQNATTDQALRLLSGTVEYVDARGVVIPLQKDQGRAVFSFYPDEQDGLLPGRETSRVIRVPFPAAALKANTLRNIRLHLTYRATPYGNDTVDGQVTLPG
jgi:hypothetical protein